MAKGPAHLYNYFRSFSNLLRAVCPERQGSRGTDTLLLLGGMPSETNGLNLAFSNARENIAQCTEKVVDKATLQTFTIFPLIIPSGGWGFTASWFQGHYALLLENCLCYQLQSDQICAMNSSLAPSDQIGTASGNCLMP